MTAMFYCCKKKEKYEMVESKDCKFVLVLSKSTKRGGQQCNRG
jgi:hypothetical protein